MGPASGAELRERGATSQRRQGHVPVAREGRRAVAEGRDVALGLVAAAEGLGRPVVVALPRADVVLRRDQSVFGPLADVVRQEQTVGLGVRRAEGEEAPAAPVEPKSLQTQEIEQISREIEDRAAFLEEAKAMGLKGEPIKRVEFEISTRKHELEQRM